MESDTETDEDERTMKELSKIGSNIHPSIITTYDCPSKNTDQKMPLLDLKVWSEGNVLRFEYFEKPMSSKFTIPVQSAHSWKMKMAVLHREAVRRLLNMDRLHSWAEVVETLNRYSRKLERSGYSARSRADIIRASIQTYWKMRKDEDEGRRPLYRSRSWCEQERDMAKQNKKTSWSNNGKTPGEIARAPLIISPLAGNSMTLKMKEVCRKFASEHSIHKKIVTRGGNIMSRDDAPKG